MRRARPPGPGRRRFHSAVTTRPPPSATLGGDPRGSITEARRPTMARTAGTMTGRLRRAAAALAVGTGGALAGGARASMSSGAVVEKKGDAMMEKKGDAMMEKKGDAMMEKKGDAMMEKKGDAMKEKK